MSDRTLEQLLESGIAAARAGKQAEARSLLLAVIARDETVESAWLWLSDVVEEPEEKQICLENVLTLNPDSIAAEKGLEWLAVTKMQSSVGAKATGSHPETPIARPVLVPVRAKAPLLDEQQAVAVTAKNSESRQCQVEIEPFGCPYCGGSVSAAEPRCNHCRRSVALRYRKKEHDTGIGWLVALFLVLALASGLEGYWVSYLLELNQLPQALNLPGVTLVVGGALFTAEGAAQQAEFAQAIVIINYVLAGLCILTALGLALKLRAVYYAAFLLLGIVVVVTLAALLVQLIGWLPAIARLALVGLGLKLLLDSAAAFEWVSRIYSADLESGLKTGPDYYNRANMYYDMGMWAKAAAHWQVAVRLDPNEVQYRADLANAYVKMGYPTAGLAEAERALALEPDNNELRTFRDSLAQWEAKG